MIEEHVNREHDCHECDASGMVERELVEHVRNEHPEEDPFADFFPEYMVCGDSIDAENYRKVYIRIDSETGPYYMAFDDQDSVEETYGYELYRHDWEYIEREDTPFPQFEE